MENFKINQIDYRYLLVDSYKSLGLSEEELALLLVVDNISREKPTLITGELLALKMNLDEKKLDNLLVSLMQRGFLEYTNLENDSNLITSLNPTYVRLRDNFVKELITSFSVEESEKKKNEVENIYGIFEKELGRSLSPFEIDKIKEWIDMGVKDGVIIDSLRECLSKNKRVTFSKIDKVIIKRLTSKDVSKEGFSAVSDKYRKDIEETIEIADTKWLDD